MAQIHSYYITNAKLELKFSSSNLSEDELETALRKITTAMINNDDLFIENEEDDIDSDDESIDLNEDDANNDLFMANIMRLDDFREQSNDNLDSNIWNQQPDESVNYEDSNIDFEAIFDKELEESD
jgi:hypothetical protein